MTTSVELLLTDEFVAFSSEIKKVHEAKKTRQEEFRKLYEAFKVELKKYDDDAAAATAKWEAFVAGKAEKSEKDKTKAK